MLDKYGNYKCSMKEHVERPRQGAWIFVSCTVQHGAAALWTLIESGKPERRFAAFKEGVVEYVDGKGIVDDPVIKPSRIAIGKGLPSVKKAIEIIKQQIAAEGWRKIVS